MRWLEVHFTELVTPPPTGIRWLITALWFLGSLGVIVRLVLIGLLVPRLTAVRQMAVAGVAALGVCLLIDGLLGPSVGRPPVAQLSGFDPPTRCCSSPSPRQWRRPGSLT